MFDLHTHTSKQRAFLLAFVALLLTFALAACGGDDDTDLGAGGLEGDTGVIGEDTGVLEEDTPLTDSTDVTGVDEGVISGDLTSEEYLAELFTVYDTDSNGLLTEDEIAAFLGNNEYLGDPTSIFDTYDENVDAYLDETEFIAFVMDNTDDFGVGPDDAPLEEAGINDPEAADAVTGDTDNGDMGAMVDNQAIDQLITPYDENADGILDESEFNTLLTDYGYMGDTAGLFDQYDANADASLDASEFNTFFTENTGEFDINTFEQNDTLGALFTPYDVNQDTYLDQEEFNAFLTDYGYTGDTAGLFDQYDANADAYLDQDEYLSFTTENITGFGAGGAEDNVVISPLFTPYDVNQDTYLDETEFTTFVGDNEFDADAADLFGQYDANSDTYLDQNEFGTLISENPGAVTTGLFAPYDGNTDTYLDQNEFSTFLDDNNYAGDATGLFDQYDANADGYLDQNELQTYLGENVNPNL